MAPRPLQSLVRAAILLALATVSSAQLSNGQFFTPGLVIIDSPSQPTPFTVGSIVPIALDISGDGLLPFPVPEVTNSTPPTAILSLQLFLVSKDTNTNISVANDSILQQELTSTVKHVNYFLPTCISSGSYNLTFYELDRVNNETFFSIYQIPLVLSNPSDHPKIFKPDSCDNSTAPFTISQDQNPPPVQPFVANGQEGTSLATAGSTAVQLSSIYTMSAPGGNGGQITVVESGGTTYLSGQGFTTIRTSIAVATVTAEVTTVGGNAEATEVATTEFVPVIIAMPTTTGGSMSGDGQIVSVGEFGVPLTGGARPLAAVATALVAGALGGAMLVGLG